MLMKKRLLVLLLCTSVFLGQSVCTFAAGPAAAARDRKAAANNSNYSSNNGSYPTDANGYIDWSGEYYQGDNTYVIAGSDSELLDKSSVKYLSDDVLRLAINEIYARHGRKFKSKDLQEFFNSKSWYTALYEPADFDKNQNKYLNEVEQKNLAILSAERDSR